MWTDHYLKCDTRETFDTAMELVDSTGMAVDTIGTLYRDDTGAATDGYHVNIRMSGSSPLPAALEPFVIPAPVMPRRVFA